MAAKKTNRLNRSRKPKAKKAKQPSFKHGLIIEIADGGISSIRSTVPGMTVVILDHDAGDEEGFANFNIDGSICQRSIEKAERTTRGTVRRFMGKGDPMPEECKKCGSHLLSNGRCSDVTCPYSDRAQTDTYTED